VVNEFSEMARIAGSIAGTIVSLAFIPPKTRVEFFGRTAASSIVGYIFGIYALPSMAAAGVLPDRNGVLAATCLTAFLAWWLLGYVIKIARARAESRIGERV
jgi:hypothetical protein